jgi:two-component system OmpR family response regulator
MHPRVLVVDDDLIIQAVARTSLKEFEVVQASDMAEARALFSHQDFSAILIDISLPDGDGLRLLNEIKSIQKFKNTPVFMLTGKTDIQNKIMAFSVGAEDFISKPFDPLELYARVSAKIARATQELHSLKTKVIGNLKIDLDRQSAFLTKNGSDTDLALTSKEFKILVLLTQRLEMVFSREQILERIWGNTHVSDRTVDSHMAHLRQKLAGTSIELDTIKNVGFRALALALAA